MRVAVAAVLMGMAAVGAAAQASANPGEDESRCMVASYLAGCDDAGLPTGPGDPGCAATPGDAMCAGSPFAPEADTPPPIGSGLPGSINTDGLPYGAPSLPPMPPPMPAGVPGMPGTI